MLIRLDADLLVFPADDCGYTHAVVVNELDLGGSGNHYIVMLQVAMGDFRTMKALYRLTPFLRDCTDRSAVVRSGSLLKPVEECVSLDPVHRDEWIPLAIRSADAVVGVRKWHKTSERLFAEMLEDCPIAILPFRLVGGEYPDRLALLSWKNRPIDIRKVPRPGPGHVSSTPLDLD